MTDAMEIALALTRIADAINNLVQAQNKVGDASSKCAAAIGELIERIKVEENKE